MDPNIVYVTTRFDEERFEQVIMPLIERSVCDGLLLPDDLVDIPESIAELIFSECITFEAACLFQ
jgi:hypothetical protein